MPIRLGTLLPDSVEIGIGVNKSRRGFALITTGEQVAVVAKRVAADVLAAEVFCASLARAAELPVPEPIIVKDQNSGTFMFGSVFREYPNLLQAFRLDPSKATNDELLVVARRLARWSKICEAIGFDEWIGNVDRNLQNLLWDGDDQFVMIDHDKCLGHLVPGRAAHNYLLLTVLAAITSDTPAIESLKKNVLQSALEFDEELADEAALSLQQVPLSPAASCSQKYFNFVTTRLPELATRLSRQFPTSQFQFEGM